MRDLQGCINEVADMLDAATPGANTYWVEKRIMDWLDEGLNIIARAGQVIYVPVQFLTVAGQTQYKLRKIDPTDIVSVKYHDGTRPIPLTECDPDECQIGIKTTAHHPGRYYKRLFVDAYEEQDDTTSDIEISDPEPDADFRTVIGFEFAPSTSDRTVTVGCYTGHPELVKPSQKILIPYPFQKGACAYAAAQALQKEKLHEEARYYYELHNDWRGKLEEYMSQKGRVGHAQMKTVEDGDLDFDWTDRVYIP